MEKGVIWLINPYGNIPGEGWSEYRFSMIARCLSSEGYQVRWFVANFEHRSKLWREANEAGIEVKPRYQISVIETTGYTSHVSTKRILFERNFAKNVLNSKIILQERPSLIVFGDPALFVADIYKKIALKSKSPYVVDILDLWPEIFIALLPSFLKKFEKIILFPLYSLRSWFFKSSIGFTAVAPDYLEIINNTKHTAKKAIIYIGLSDEDNLEEQVEEKPLSLNKSSDDIWLVYAGTLGYNYDIETIIEFASLINSAGLRNVKIIMAGDGEMKKKVIEYNNFNKNSKLLYLGRLSYRELSQVYKMSDIAISSYNKTSPVSMPLKVFDYFYYGLPIINSLNREVARLIQTEVVGIQYEAGNVESMWSAFIQLYEDEDLRTRMSSNSKELGKRFTFKKQYKKYVNFINELKF
jgi:glycosyltransferase involved in cell wall biosynthesis